jgi:hypothetical protein
MEPQDVSAHVTHHPPFKSAARLLALAVFAPVGAILALPVLMAIYCYLVPAHTARVELDQIGATVEIAFYYTFGERIDGRTLTISTRWGRVTQRICGYDWAHRARTNLYLTADRRIAILGSENGCEALATITPLAITDRIDGSTQDWTYLGVFDFTPQTRRRVFRFFPAAEQAECVPWSPGGERLGTSRHREAAWGRCR